MPLDVNGAERACRTKVFASSAADAALDVHDGNFGRIRHSGIGSYHDDRARRTMAGAVAAFHAVCQRNAVFPDPYGMTYLDGRLVCRRDFQNRARRTYFRTFRTFGPAVAELVRGYGLHERRQRGRRAQHARRTHRHAKLAARAVRGHVTEALRAGRHDRGGAVRNLLVRDDGQAAVHFFLLRPRHGCRGEQTQTGQKAPSGGIGLPAAVRDRYGRTPTALVPDRSAPALIDAIHAGDTARIIDLMLPAVDTRRLAPAGALSATVAFRNVDDRPQQRKAGKEPEHRTHRANRVAVGTTVPPRQNGQRREHGDSDRKGRQALDPDIRPVESVAAGPFGEAGQQVVAPLPKRREKIRSDTPVSSVRVQQRHDGAYARRERYDEQRKHRIAQPRQRRRMGIAVFPAPSSQPAEHVLHHAQRTNDRTINASQQQREQYERRHDAEIQGQYRRQELDLGQPAEPCMDRSREIEKQQCDRHETKDGERYSDFSQHASSV